jgi:uncharacterized membrane protein AbrB (regulator of aidB expression)
MNSKILFVLYCVFSVLVFGALMLKSHFLVAWLFGAFATGSPAYLMPHWINAVKPVDKEKD